MTEAEFWREVRRGLITIARAISRRYGWAWACIVLGVDSGG